MTAFVEVQQIVGRRVRDSAGRDAGRIEAIRAEIHGPQCVVHEYLLGTAALLSRLGMNTARLFGFSTRPKLLRVPWPQLDLTDPSRPAIRCSLDELKSLQPQLPPLIENDGPPKRIRGND